MGTWSFFGNRTPPRESNIQGNTIEMSFGSFLSWLTFQRTTLCPVRGPLRRGCLRIKLLTTDLKVAYKFATNVPYLTQPCLQPLFQTLDELAHPRRPHMSSSTSGPMCGHNTSPLAIHRPSPYERRAGTAHRTTAPQSLRMARRIPYKLGGWAC